MATGYDPLADQHAPPTAGSASAHPGGFRASYPATAAPGYPGATPAFPGVANAGGGAPGYSDGSAPSYPGVSGPGQVGGTGPSGYPPAPGGSAGGAGHGGGYPVPIPRQPDGAPPYPAGGSGALPYPAGGSGGPASGYPGFADPASARVTGSRRTSRWPRVLAGLVIVALVAVAGVQAYQIGQLSHRLSQTDRRLADAQRAEAGRLDGLDGRTGALEKQAGTVFNPEAVASTVLPSVFRVRAGDFTGTAFAIGKPAAGGDTNLFTNFHVVEEVWRSGGRKVDLERTDQRFPATIVKVDQTNDLAQLRTDGHFTGLTAAAAAVKSGQQIVVVGAPLGLEDTVTTGVVSAFRKAEDKSGPVIQFDAPINPGNSGGPVINGAKQVVGIATAKARDAEGIGLAIPIKTACDSIPIC